MAQLPQEVWPRGAYLCRMAEIHTVTTLRSKRAEIIAATSNYEKRLAQARANLAHITAASLGRCRGYPALCGHSSLLQAWRSDEPMQGSARQRTIQYPSACLEGHGRKGARYWR